LGTRTCLGGSALGRCRRVSETVIAAVLLLHKHGVDEIVLELSTAEIEDVIKFVG